MPLPPTTPTQRTPNHRVTAWNVDRTTPHSFPTAINTPQTRRFISRRPTPTTEPSVRQRHYVENTPPTPVESGGEMEVVGGRRIPKAWAGRIANSSPTLCVIPLSAPSSTQKSFSSQKFNPPPALTPLKESEQLFSIASSCRSGGGAPSANATPHWRFRGESGRPGSGVIAPGISLGFNSENLSITSINDDPEPSYGSPFSRSSVLGGDEFHSAFPNDFERCDFVRHLLDTHLHGGSRSPSMILTPMVGNYQLTTPSFHTVTPQLSRLATYLRPASYWPYRVNDPYDAGNAVISDTGGDRSVMRTRITVPDPVLDLKGFDSFSVVLDNLRSEVAMLSSQSRARARASQNRSKSRAVGNWPNWATVGADLAKGCTTVSSGSDTISSSAAMPQTLSAASESDEDDAFGMATFGSITAPSEDPYFPFESLDTWRVAVDKMTSVYRRYCSRMEAVSCATSPALSPCMSPLVSPRDSIFSVESIPTIATAFYSQLDVVATVVRTGGRMSLVCRVEGVDMLVDDSTMDRSTVIDSSNKSRFAEWVDFCTTRGSENLINEEAHTRSLCEQDWLEELIQCCTDLTSALSPPKTNLSRLTHDSVVSVLDPRGDRASVWDIVLDVEQFTSPNDSGSHFDVFIECPTASKSLQQLLRDYIEVNGIVSRVTFRLGGKSGCIEATICGKVSWSTILAQQTPNGAAKKMDEMLSSNGGQSVVLLRGCRQEGAFTLSDARVGLYTLERLTDTALLDGLLTDGGSHEAYLYTSHNLPRVISLAHEILCTNTESVEDQIAQECKDEMTHYGFVVSVMPTTIREIMESDLNRLGILPFSPTAPVNVALEDLSQLSCASLSYLSSGIEAKTSYLPTNNPMSSSITWMVTEIVFPSLPTPHTQPAGACSTPINGTAEDFITPTYQRLPWGVGDDDHLDSPVMTAPPTASRVVRVKPIRPTHNLPNKESLIEPQNVAYRRAKVDNRPEMIRDDSNRVGQLHALFCDMIDTTTTQQECGASMHKRKGLTQSQPPLSPSASENEQSMTMNRSIADEIAYSPHEERNPIEMVAPNCVGMESPHEGEASITGVDVCTTLHDSCFGRDMNIWELNANIAIICRDLRNMVPMVMWPSYTPDSQDISISLSRDILNFTKERPTPTVRGHISSLVTRLLSDATEDLRVFNFLSREARHARIPKNKLSDIFQEVRKSMSIDADKLGTAPMPVTPVKIIQQLRPIAASIRLVRDQLQGQYIGVCLQDTPGLKRQLEVSGLWVESRSSVTTYGILSNQWMALWSAIQFQQEGPSEVYARVKKLWIPTQQHGSLGMMASDIMNSPPPAPYGDRLSVWALLSNAHQCRPRVLLALLQSVVHDSIEEGVAIVLRELTMLSSALSLAVSGCDIVTGAPLSSLQIMWLTEIAILSTFAVSVIISTENIYSQEVPSLQEDILSVRKNVDGARLFALYHLSNDACCQLALVPSIRAAMTGTFPNPTTCDHANSCRYILVNLIMPILEAVEDLRSQLEDTSYFVPQPHAMQIEVALNVILQSLQTPLHIPYPGDIITYKHPNVPAAEGQNHDVRTTSLLGITSVPSSGPDAGAMGQMGDVFGAFTRFDSALERLVSCEGRLRRFNVVQTSEYEDTIERLKSKKNPSSYLTYLCTLKREVREFIANYHCPRIHIPGQAHSGSLRALVDIVTQNKFSNIYNIHHPVRCSIKELLRIRKELDRK